MKNKLNIVFVTDDNYFKHMFIAIESIINNTKKTNCLTFYILDLGISLLNKNLLHDKYNNYSNVNLEFLNVDSSELIKYKIKTHVSTAAYSKIYICDLIKVDKIIYLDSDLIFNDDILNLWNEFDNEVSIKAVWNPFYNYDNKYLGVADNCRTFNSGVMLLNLDLMRKNGSSKELENYLNKYHDKTKLHDQAAFNAIFKDDWSELDEKWNYQVSMIQNSHIRLGIDKKTYFNLYNNPSIIHFTTNSKPWQFRNNHPYKKLYLKFYRDVLGELENKDINLKSLLQRIREILRYKYFYINNILNK
jgi:lipopolysaccharide biosynthesis glycosyltransferase